MARLPSMDQTSRGRLWVAVSLCCVTVAWTYSARILWPWERFADEQRGAWTSTLGDFYSRWVGTRALLREHKNPYGEEVSHEIQMGFYGRQIAQRDTPQGSPVVDEQRFAYPVYVVLLLSPSAWLSFDTAQKWIQCVLAVLAAMSAILSLRIIGWPGWFRAVSSIAFVLATPQILQGLHLRQLGILVAFLVLFAAWAVRNDHPGAAGAALAFSTIKPQMAALPLTWFLIWSFGDLQRRWRLLAAFAGTLAILVSAGEWILTGWIGDFFHGVVAYRKYAGSSSLLQLALGSALGVTSVLLVVVAVLWWGWRNRGVESDSVHFAHVFSGFLTVATLAVPLMAPFNQVLLILPAFLVAQDWKNIPKSLRLILAVVIGFPWLAQALLLVFPPQVRSLSWWPLMPSTLVFSIPFLLAATLVYRFLSSNRAKLTTQAEIPA